MSDKEALLFRDAVENMCGEANEAARLARVLFEGDELKVVRRELARVLEIVESKLLPIYRSRFPNVER